MEDSDIKLYLSIERWTKLGPVYAGLVVIFFFSNAYFSFIDEIESNLSVVLGFMFLPYFAETVYRDTTMAKCHALIRKLINRDSELLKQVSEYKKNV